MKTMTLLCIVLTVSLLVDCSNDSGPVSGGDDFPNCRETLSAAGTTIRADLDSAAQWRGFTSVADSVPEDFGPYPPINYGLLFGEAASEPGYAGFCDTVWSWADTLSGTVTAEIHCENNVGTMSLEYRITMRYPGSENDFGPVTTVEGVRRNRTLGRSKWWRSIDADNDGRLDSAMIIDTVYGPADTIVVKKTAVSGGLDRDLSKTVDNAIVFWERSVRVGADTIAVQRATDKDDDGVLGYPRVNDTSYVGYESDRFNVSPAGAREHIRIILAIDSLNSWCRYYHKVRHGGGIRYTTHIHGSGPDSIIRPADTALAYRIVDDGRDTVLHISYQFLVGEEAVSRDGSALVGYTREGSHDQSRFVASRFDFQTDSATANADTLSSGAFVFSAETRNRRMLEIVGVIDTEYIRGAYTFDGLSGEIVWDRSGEVVDTEEKSRK